MTRSSRDVASESFTRPKPGPSHGARPPHRSDKLKRTLSALSILTSHRDWCHHRGGNFRPHRNGGSRCRCFQSLTLETPVINFIQAWLTGSGVVFGRPGAGPAIAVSFIVAGNRMRFCCALLCRASRR